MGLYSSNWTSHSPFFVSCWKDVRSRYGELSEAAEQPAEDAGGGGTSGWFGVPDATWQAAVDMSPIQQHNARSPDMLTKIDNQNLILATSMRVSTELTDMGDNRIGEVSR